jgi:hypothetical protein
MKHIGACSAMSSRAIKGIMKRYDIVWKESSQWWKCGEESDSRQHGILKNKGMN